MVLDIIACIYGCLAVLYCIELGGVCKVRENQVEVTGMKDVT